MNKKPAIISSLHQVKTIPTYFLKFFHFQATNESLQEGIQSTEICYIENNDTSNSIIFDEKQKFISVVPSAFKKEMRFNLILNGS